MKIKKVIIMLCEACLRGEGDECHTPECALCFHNSPGHPIHPELYEVIQEWESDYRVYRDHQIHVAARERVVSVSLKDPIR